MHLVKTNEENADDDARIKAQGLMRQAFDAIFMEAEKKNHTERLAIVHQFPTINPAELKSKLSFNPYAGMPMPETSEGDKGYAELAQAMNSKIGTVVPLSEIKGFRADLQQIWGKNVNVRLPFFTGLEAFNGPHHLEVVLENENEKLVVRGYSYNYSNLHPLIGS